MTSYIHTGVKYPRLEDDDVAAAGYLLDSLAQLAPGKFLSTPGLWLGLTFAAAFLFAAVRLRRYRGPI